MQDLYVIFNLPYPILIPDSTALDPDRDGPSPEIYVAGDPPCGVKTVLMGREGGTFQAWGELQGGDPYGRVSYTRVQVRFNAGAATDLKGWSDDELLEYAVDRVNHLVAHYRDLACQPVLRGVNVRDLVHFWVVEEAPGVPPVKRQLAQGRGPLRVGIGDDERAIDRALRDRLQTPEPVPFLRQIELDAQRHLEAGDYPLAVIESALLFEGWLGRLLRQRFLDQGFSEPVVEGMFLDRNRRPLSIWAIAKDLLPRAYGINFVTSPEGLAWAAHVKDARNRLVHGQQEGATRSEGEAAIHATHDAIRMVQAAVDALSA